jgi:L-serine/L-threonine ammonia-lyase
MKTQSGRNVESQSQARARPLHVRTPLIRSQPLSRAAGTEVWLKLENTQPTGSFKLRGIGRLCQRAASAGASLFVASSGGNAGWAAAYAARELGIPAIAVITEGADPQMQARIEAEGAQLIRHGRQWRDADALARSLVAERNATYVPPFDHPDIWAGHATLVAELTEDIAPPDYVLASVGGGGLLSGVIEGLRLVGWTRTRVIGIETHGAAKLAAALTAGHPVTLDAINTVAKNLGAHRIADGAFERAVEWGVQSRLVDDAATLAACHRFLDDHRMLVEPACGAVLAAAYAGLPELAAAERVVVVVDGGACITHDQLHALRPA